MNLDLDKILKGIKKEGKKIRKELPNLINNFSGEIRDLKKLQKTVETQAKKISTATLKSLAEQVFMDTGYKVSEEGGEIVAVKGRSRVLVAALPKKEDWAERMEDCDCTKGLVFTLEPPTEEAEKSWKKLKTDVKSIKNLVDWLAS
mgnify:CR=1 FL=1